MEQNPIREQLGPRRALDYGSLDAWRGLACLAVVFYHCYLEGSPRIKTRPLAFEWAQFGNVGVQIFFVISGFCIAVAAHSAWHKRAWGRFAWGRVSRIYPPFWAALALAFAFKLFAERMNAGAVQYPVTKEEPLFYFANLTLLNSVFDQVALLRVSWSLSYEVAFYGIVFLTLVAFSRAKTANSMLNALHALSLGVMLWLLVSSEKSFHPTFPLNLWPQFGLGILVFDALLAQSQNEEKRQRFLWAIGLGFATLGGAFLAKCSLSSELKVRASLAQFAVSFGFALILWLAYRYEDSISRWNFVKLLRSIGTFSYSIYLVHFTLIIALSRGLFSRPRLTFVPWFVEVIIEVCFSVGCGWIFYQMVEKPSQKLKRVGR